MEQYNKGYTFYHNKIASASAKGFNGRARISRGHQNRQERDDLYRGIGLSPVLVAMLPAKRAI
jgi:hypothetical protein